MSSVIISGDTSGAITLSAPAVAGTNTATLPAATGTVMVSGNMPTFRAVSNITQSLTVNVTTKATCYTTVQWDTASCYNSSTNRYTPNVAGYYEVKAGIQYGALSAQPYIYIYKNGSVYTRYNLIAASGYGNPFITGLVYMNGSTDYLEVYLESDAGSGSAGTSGDNAYCYFSAAMIRGA